MYSALKIWTRTAMICIGFALVGAEAATAADLAGWQGLYRNPDGEVLRIESKRDAISMDIFSLKNGSWRLATAWGAIATSPDYVEFHQRSEPDGLWLSISFAGDSATLVRHNGTARLNESIFKKLSESETSQISHLLVQAGSISEVFK